MHSLVHSTIGQDDNSEEEEEKEEEEEEKKQKKGPSIFFMFCPPAFPYHFALSLRVVRSPTLSQI